MRRTRGLWMRGRARAQKGALASAGKHIARLAHSLSVYSGRASSILTAASSSLASLGLKPASDVLSLDFFVFSVELERGGARTRPRAETEGIFPTAYAIATHRLLWPRPNRQPKLTRTVYSGCWGRSTRLTGRRPGRLHGRTSHSPGAWISTSVAVHNMTTDHPACS